MKFLVCLVLCFAAAQAGLVGVPSALTYASPYSTFSTGLAPSLYHAPLAYSSYAGIPTTYSAGLAAPTVYNTAGLGLGGHYLRSAYAPSIYSAPRVYSTPSVYSTLLKK